MFIIGTQDYISLNSPKVPSFQILYEAPSVYVLFLLSAS